MSALLPANVLLPRLRKQRGAVLMVMLVILIVGIAALLVSSLNSTTLLAERSNITSIALAQAKEGLIGRAVTDGNHPGSLPCPDISNNGTAPSTVGQPGLNCPAILAGCHGNRWGYPT